MRWSKKHFRSAALVVSLCTLLAFLLASCSYDTAYFAGEKAEQVRKKVDELLTGFMDGSGWCSTAVIVPFLLSGLGVVLQRARRP
jgi:hypothetical protein